MTALLDMSAARVFFDGIFANPRIAHPEGIAIHADGSIWCGNELGELLRIASDGSGVERLGGTGGFALGIAFDSKGNCFICDLRHAAVFRYDSGTRRVERFASSGIMVPNYPVIDEARGALYVSDSRGNGQYRAGHLSVRPPDRRGRRLEPGADGLRQRYGDDAGRQRALRCRKRCRASEFCAHRGRWIGRRAAGYRARRAQCAGWPGGRA